MSKKEKERETKTGLTPWRPFGEIARWEREMFDDFFGRRLRPWFTGGLGEISVPAIDLYEEKDEVVAKAELPGMDKNDIQVSISDHLLTIKGEKKKDEEIKESDYYRSERSYGSFVRNVQLPKEVDTGKARASFKNGVLEIRLPKSEEAKKKEIKLNVD
jgi:HSP20 family protein